MGQGLPPAFDGITTDPELPQDSRGDTQASQAATLPTSNATSSATRRRMRARTLPSAALPAGACQVPKSQLSVAACHGVHDAPQVPLACDAVHLLASKPCSMSQSACRRGGGGGGRGGGGTYSP